MAAPLIQPSFAAGELSPTLFGRVDLGKYKVGAARLYNCYVDYRGGVTSRSGTKFVGMAGLNASPIRLIKFQFSITQTCVLEFGHHYMRVIVNGGLVLGGDGNPYFISTPWAAGDLPLLKFAQSNDVMTLTHPGYQPYDLSRLAENNWQLTPVTFDVTNQQPTGLLVTVAPAATTDGPFNVYYYVITAVDANGVESLPSVTGAIQCDSFSTRTQSIIVAWAPTPSAVYYNVYKGTPVVPSASVPDFPSAATYGYIGRTYGVQLVDNNILPDFTKSPPTHTDPFAPGAIQRIDIATSGAGYRAGNTTVTVNDPTGTGFKGLPIINGSTVVGVQILSGGRGYTNPQVVITSPTGASATAAATVGPTVGINPGVVTYYQQRKVFAASFSAPATYWATRTGAFNNMDYSIPSRDNDALTFTLAALEQNPIKYMIPVQNGLIMLTGGAAWLVNGSGQNTAVTPNSVQQTPQVYNGCADVLPLIVGNNVLYVQEKGYVVQDLSFNILNNVFGSVDRTYLSSHLFQNKQVTDWCWAQQPHYLVWAVMNDGTMLSMTYIPEQEVFGWAQHQTMGNVVSVAAISEGSEDVVYLAVQRPFGFTIERMAERRQTSSVDAWTLDCALRYVGPTVTRVTGLPMANGEVIAALCDGVFYPGLIVQGGGVDLPVPASNVLAGYPFPSEFQSLAVDAGEPTIQGKRQRVSAITAKLVESRGVSIGPDFATLYANKTDPVAPNLYSGDERIVIAQGWNNYGQVCLRNIGYPWTLTALIPEVSVGDTNG